MESAKQEEAHNSPKDNGFSKKPFWLFGIFDYNFTNFIKLFIFKAY